MHKVHCNQGPLVNALQKHQEERTDIRDMLALYNVQLGLMEEEMKQVEVESVHLYLKIENRKKILTLLETLTSVMEINDKYLFVLNEGNFTDSSFAVAEQEVKVESQGEPSTFTDGIASNTLTRRQLPLMLEALQKLSKSLHQLQPKSHGGSKISEIADLFAVKERLALFKSVAINFCQKFSQAMKEIILQQVTSKYFVVHITIIWLVY